MRKARWVAHGFVRGSIKGTFAFDSELGLRVHGALGPKGLNRVGCDLLDLASVVFQIERHLTGKQRTNPAVRFELTLPVRDRSRWTKANIDRITNILRRLGNAEWSITLEQGNKGTLPKDTSADEAEVSTIALFSGGLDSTCGASILAAPNKTRLVSFYTGQKTLQKQLAEKLELSSPIQWTWSPRPTGGRGVSYFYRSFLFLALAAVTAESWRARKILQYENGILALSIPPAANYRMTCHAHPEVHRVAAELFSSLFGGDWTIENPFELKTKRECYTAMVSALGKKPAAELALMTETCWAYRSPRVRGGNKKPGMSCGVCIPCIVRRTAFSEGKFRWDLREDAPRNHRQLGVDFRAYYGLVERLLKRGRTSLDFYMLLNSAGRDLIEPVGPFKIEEVDSLFRRFANEFTETFL